MRRLSLFILSCTLFLSACGSEDPSQFPNESNAVSDEKAEKQPLPLMEYDLVEFSIATAYGKVACSQKEIEAGLWELPLLDGGISNGTIVMWKNNKKPPGRELTPSRHPLHRLASWYIDQDECSSLKNVKYFNGLGFDSFNRETGEVVAYLAAFRVSSQLDVSGNEVSFYRTLYQPDFEVFNVVRFNGTCAWESTPLYQRLLRKHRVICNFPGKGQVVLAHR